MPGGTIGNLRLLNKDTVLKRTFDNIQKVSFNNVPTLGAFKLKYNDIATASIAYNANVAAIKTALEDLADITEVTVSGSFSSGFTIHFTGTDGNQDKLKIEYDSNTLKAVAIDTLITIEVLSRGYDNLGEYVEASPSDTTIKGLIAPIPEGRRINITQFYDIKSADYSFYTKEILTDDDLIVYMNEVYRIKVLKPWSGYSEVILYLRVLK